MVLSFKPVFLMRVVKLRYSRALQPQRKWINFMSILSSGGDREAGVRNNLSANMCCELHSATAEVSNREK